MDCPKCRVEMPPETAGALSTLYENHMIRTSNVLRVFVFSLSYDLDLANNISLC